MNTMSPIIEEKIIFFDYRGHGMERSKSIDTEMYLISEFFLYMDKCLVFKCSLYSRFICSILLLIRGSNWLERDFPVRLIVRRVQSVECTMSSSSGIGRSRGRLRHRWHSAAYIFSAFLHLSEIRPHCSRLEHQERDHRRPRDRPRSDAFS